MIPLVPLSICLYHVLIKIAQLKVHLRVYPVTQGQVQAVLTKDICAYSFSKTNKRLCIRR